jgi:hypothetical protein
LKEKSDASSISAIRDESSNLDVQEVTEDQNNNLSEDAPLLPAPVVLLPSPTLTGESLQA